MCVHTVVQETMLNSFAFGGRMPHYTHSTVKHRTRAHTKCTSSLL